GEVLHRVVDRERGRLVAALGVDVEVDLAPRCLGLEVQQLGDERVRDARVDPGAEVDDALGEQVRVDVHDPVAARVRRDDVRDGVPAHAGAPNPTGVRRSGRSWSNESTIPSTNPYSFASAAVNQWSCRESSKTRSTGCPVSSA